MRLYNLYQSLGMPNTTSPWFHYQIAVYPSHQASCHCIFNLPLFPLPSFIPFISSLLSLAILPLLHSPPLANHQPRWAKWISNLIHTSDIPIPICAAYDYWDIILCFGSHLFVFCGPWAFYTSAPVALSCRFEPFHCTWIPSCRDFDPPTSHLCWPVTSRSTLEWAFTF